MTRALLTAGPVVAARKLRFALPAAWTAAFLAALLAAAPSHARLPMQRAAAQISGSSLQARSSGPRVKAAPPATRSAAETRRRRGNSTSAGRTASARKAGAAAVAAAPGAVLAQRASYAPPSAGNRVPIAHLRGAPEARLIEIYRLIGAERLDAALRKARELVEDVPNFQLAQLTYGDLLRVRSGEPAAFGAVPQQWASTNTERLAQLRDEAVQRLQGLSERPPTGAMPRQFIELPASVRHAIAVDASRSRLYLFETGSAGLKLVADHYVSLGRLGIDKAVVGDQRTPLGVYFITNRLDARQLSDFYGSGALQLNYPNEYDRRLGKTGSGIWLHGVPSDSFSRGPHSTDGCVALANTDLQTLLDKIRPRATPVLIAPRLEWVTPLQVEGHRRALRGLVEGWQQARSSGDVERTLSFYSAQFASGQQGLDDWRRVMLREVQGLRGRRTELKDLSILTWKDKTDLMVVTFGEVVEGERSGPVRRQYWSKEGDTWKIFFEGVIG